MNIADGKRIEKKIARTEKNMDRYKKMWQKTDQKLSAELLGGSWG